MVDIVDFLEVREDPSVPLFHYTSVSKLPKILESGSLWATDVRYMKDSKELQHGINVLDAAAGLNVLPRDRSGRAILEAEWLPTLCELERQRLVFIRAADYNDYCSSFTTIDTGIVTGDADEIANCVDRKSVV